MKKFSIISIGILAIVLGFLPIAATSAYTSPGKPTGFVNDFAGVLSVTEKQNIESKLSTLKDQTGFEVAVAIVNSLGNETIESYATKLFEDWGVGDAKKDTGILLLVAPNEREVKIETGYGAEGAVTDIQAGNIIRIDILPAFREGKYAEGISGAVSALNSIISKSPEAAEYSVTSPGSSGANQSAKSSSSNLDFGWIIFLFVVVVNVLAKILGKTKSWWLGGVLGAIVGAIIGLIWGFVYIGVVSVVVLTVLGLIFDFIVSKNPPGSGHGGHGGFWPIFFGGGRGGSSGFGGGGFGGFGGGSSGGGGASGSW